MSIPVPVKALIVNADDFGYSERVNAAVLRAHREGILTSASLMVAEPGFEEAVALARTHPNLGVGLHVATTYDHPLLPPAEIPALIGGDGKFGRDPFLTGLRYAFSRTAQKQLRREMEAQFARFAVTGLPWSHADGHQHFHLHPVVWANFLDLCDQYGVHHIRLPRENLRSHLRIGGQTPALNTVACVFLEALSRRCLRMLQNRRKRMGTPFFVCDQVYGSYQTGNMTTDYTLRILGQMQSPYNELYFHPGAPHARPLPPDQRHDGIEDVELAALLDPAVRARVEALSLPLCTYAEAACGDAG
ncbi:MAG: hopanoid biosynthesis associated protein HpnK [Chthonomonadaceae bacterium]|nr:hopanoid biosynthesis associated protein HpnK [Chthonomonadaceae bacterium]